MLKDHIQLFRPHQYAKNVFIFLPIFFGLKIFDNSLLLDTIITFIAFCLAASSIYIFNDYYDIEEDKKHPEKKNRPLASGKVSKSAARVSMFILLLSGLLIAISIKVEIFILISVYIVLNIFYTIILKHIVIIDVFIVSIGFILRLFIGSESSNVPLSMWIVLMTFLLALFLALAKRRDDVLLYIESGDKVRTIIDGYNLEFLNVSMMIMASVTIVSYIMYTISPEVMSKTHTDKLYLTVIWVLLGILRYMQLTFVENKSGSPTMILLKDRFIQLVIFSWFITFWLLIYT